MSDLPKEAVVAYSPTKTHTEAERDGLHDGSLGQTWREYRKVLEHKAEQRRIEDTLQVRRQLEIQEAELNLAKEAEADALGEFKRVEEQYRLVATEKDRNPSGYNAIWGWVYVLLAFALVAADFPLTRQIVSAMSIGSDTNWTVEQLMVSGGIVALSLFFKLLTDPFTQPRYLMGAGWRVTLQVVSGILFVGLMAGVVSMLILLGMFRAGTVGADTGVSASRASQSEGQPPDNASSTAEPAGAIDSRLRALEGFRDQTFIVMSLILPIIGGIFASVGMARIHNAFRLRRLKSERDRLRWKLDKASEGKELAAAAVRGFGHDLTAIRERMTLAGGEYHTYLHAYETGVARPELERIDLGMTARLQAVVEKWTAIVDQLQNFARTDDVSLRVTPALPGDDLRPQSAAGLTPGQGRETDEAAEKQAS